MKLVHNWRHSRKWISLHCMTLAAAVQGAWIYIPDDMRHSIPDKLITDITIGLLVLGIIGRFINQTKEKK